MDTDNDNKPKNYFEELNAVNVSDKTEKKNGLTYLSWAWAWGELKKRYPMATYRVETQTVNGKEINYFDDGRTAWVEVSVTIPIDDDNYISHLEMLPVMDARNRSIPVEAITSTDVNKAIQRALTKAIARHGLGLYIYAGEDLPEVKDDEARAAIEAARNLTELRKVYREYVAFGVNGEKLLTWCNRKKIELEADDEARAAKKTTSPEGDNPELEAVPADER